MSTTTNLSTLKINYLTDAQFQTALDGGQINDNEIYLTPSSDGGGTSVPTANSTAKFDSSAHMNSTDMTSSEVTSFISGLDGQGTSLADYVTEQGTDGIWTYRKWYSGIAECWGYKTRSTAVFTTWVSNIWYSYIAGEDFPVGLFIATPIVEQFIQSESGRIMIAGTQNAQFGTVATNTNCGGCTLYSNDSYYNGKAFIVTQFISAKGRWK